MLRASLFAGTAVLVALLASCSKDSAPADGTSSSSGGTSGSGGGTSGNGGTSGTTGGTSGNPGGTSGGTSGTTSERAISPDVTVSDESVDVDGAARSFKLVVPKTYDANKKYPLIVALHGDGENAGMFITFSNLDTVAGKEAVMAFSDQSLDLEPDSADQKMIPAIIGAVKGKRSIDPSKIWGFGYSKGAFQIGEIVCRNKGIFTAVAAHAGGAPQERDDEGGVVCPNPDTIPMFFTQGSNDGEIGSEFFAQSFAQFAGCDAFGDRAKTKSDICEKFNGCPNDLSIFYCVVPGQSHYPLYGNAAADSLAFFKGL